MGYRRTPRTFRPDRVCAASGCSTRLSIYNDGTLCSAHGSHRLHPSADPGSRAVVTALHPPGRDDPTEPTTAAAS